MIRVKAISSLKSADGQKINIVDFFVDPRRDKISQLICQIGLFPFTKEHLIPSSIVDWIEVHNGVDYLQCYFEKKELGRFRSRSNVKTVSERTNLTFAVSEMNIDTSDYIVDFNHSAKGSSDEAQQNSPNYISYKSLKSFYIETSSTYLGKFHDFLIDSDNWTIQYIVTNISDGIRNDLRFIPYNTLTSASWLSCTLYTNIDVATRAQLPSMVTDPATQKEAI